jgi:hypothetical protein
MQQENIMASVQRRTETAIQAVAISQEKCTRVVSKIQTKNECKG